MRVIGKEVENKACAKGLYYSSFDHGPYVFSHLTLLNSLFEKMEVCS